MALTVHEIWKRKSLLFTFAVSDLKVRYKNSILGFFWTLLEPLLTLGVLYIVFSSIFKSQIENFPLFLLLGIVVYNMFQRGTQIGLNSIISRSGILTQIYFPRQIPAISSTITSSLMLIFELVAFGFFMVAFKFVPPQTIVYLPLILLLEFVLTLGLCLPLSTLNVKYRDIQFIWALILQIGFFLTPIFYNLDVLPKTAQKVLFFSPMVQIVTMARDVTLYGKIPSVESIEVSVVTTAVIFLIGYAIFWKMQSTVFEEL